MSDINTGVAPAAAEPAPVSAEQVVHTPNPVRTDPQPQAKAEPEKKEADAPKPSAREAIARAREKVNEQEKAEGTKPVKSEAKTSDPGKVDTKDPAKNEARTDATKQAADNRDERGQFKAKDAAAGDQQQPGKDAAADQQQAAPKSRYEAPKRFSSDVAATADWEKVPETVQAAVHRVHREMEEGIAKYKSSHDRYEPIREFDEIAKKNGHELRQSLGKVVEIEQAFARNPVEGFQKICDHFGINSRKLAAHIAGMKPEDVQVQQEGTISDLKREVASLKQQISGVSDGFQKQQSATTSKEVEAFAADNPRFYDLMGDVAFFLKSDKVDQDLEPLARLKAAYELAERLNPDPNSKPATTAAASDADAAKASDANSEALAVQTRKGEKSISGAPTAGSDPANREPSTSIKDSLKRAFAQAG
ncbi:hypothetical protein [Neorhizobium galegae]|uniref:Structural protein n=1 Tax=Neorhizobium galegae bv. officinalis TaxID=323656 RepID=A0A0T7GYL2_NEOGA|nr:hypothetical protein [Neorhizobium galegae]CDZ52288.1 Structural protein [Neorhizobium galegae bv. officinalis]